jgi:diguanylate cyclase (GGDEF)-like protein
VPEPDLTRTAPSKLTSATSPEARADGQAPRARLNLLLIEDSPDDAVLVTRALTRAGYDVDAQRVFTADALRTALSDRAWDLAIADFTMPSFTGTAALAIVREAGLDLPFIFVSGTIGEHVAVAAMKDGAHDYIMKGNLARLAPAVDRELREAEVRRERRRANERVAYLAYHDPLTDLPNRALLQDRLHQAILTSRRDGKSLALLTLDLDGFKEVNDALGHHAGDKVLQQVSARLRATLRESDTVARFGGDEFAVLLPVTETDGAERTARKILQALEEPVVVDGRPLAVHGSIGISCFPLHAANSDELLQKADVAMYLAKSEQSGYAVYSPERDRHTEHRLSLMTALRRGVDDKEFVLDYQPIVELRSGRVCAIEALLRWNHPDQGRLLPKDFIRLAEHTGLITPLTSFAVERSLADWAASPSAPPFRIAVNLSPRSLNDPAFPGRVRRMLEARGASADWLALEITENLIMSDPERSIRSLTELHEMGIRLILDDFGTGYSSLSYLRRFPVDELKIDQSFVIGLAGGEDEALVRSIIGLAHNLKLNVVAEGVETEDVRDRLISLGCDAVQGHYICRPATAATIAAWMSAGTGG